MFKGSIVALVTPMTNDGQIDYPSLKKLVEFHLSQGTDGIVSVGTTGESATLPVEEHMEVVKKTVEYAKGNIPVIAGSGANSTDEAIFLSHSMQNLGVEAFLTVVPYYNKPQQKGMIAHFRAIADSTHIPNILYNVPSRTVADMLPETVAVLAEHDNIVGLKDATGDMQVLADLKRLLPDDFCLLSGDDSTCLEFMLGGGDGVISVSANVAPQAVSDICRAALGGDTELARSLNDKFAALHSDLFIEPNPVLPKWCLQRMGLMESAFLRLPLVEAELSNAKHIEDIMKQVGIELS
ncbi:4-hydroxy-tetrahydrodipicolinate synthase [Alteromonadaceae bacterium M269]|nr:4-hydroxy-tetrahydrodipicolinate synthase [Alteromonadaceae bacterium M269]